MSKQISEMTENYLIKNGGEGRDKAVKDLSDLIGAGQTTLRRWISTNHFPDAHANYRIALACGRSDDEALRIAREGRQEAKKTA